MSIPSWLEELNAKMAARTEFAQVWMQDPSIRPGDIRIVGMGVKGRRAVGFVLSVNDTIDAIGDDGSVVSVPGKHALVAACSAEMEAMRDGDLRFPDLTAPYSLYASTNLVASCMQHRLGRLVGRCEEMLDWFAEFEELGYVPKHLRHLTGLPIVSRRDLRLLHVQELLETHLRVCQQGEVLNHFEAQCV
jgi:hypothetical protein